MLAGTFHFQPSEIGRMKSREFLFWMKRLETWHKYNTPKG